MKNRVLVFSFIIIFSGCKVQDSHRDNPYDLIIGDRNPHELFLNSSPGKKMILDVDMCTDVDDVCAVRIATAFDDEGIIDLRGIAYSVTAENNLEAMRGFLLYEGNRMF